MTSFVRNGDCTLPGERRPMSEQRDWLEDMPVERRWPAWVRLPFIAIVSGAAWFVFLIAAIEIRSLL